MSDAATKLAEEIKARHRLEPDGSFAYPGELDDTCSDCGCDYPCDAVRAADMLLELARDRERLDWLSENPAANHAATWRAWFGRTWRQAIDAARNATQEKPNE